MQRTDLGFDDSDKNLFEVDDPRLRADALRHSVLPRLHLVMHECIAKIREVFGVEALDDSIVSYFPHFRPKRQAELKLLYDSAYVALGGKRTKGKWNGVSRKDEKPVQILPFRLGLELTHQGLSIRDASPGSAAPSAPADTRSCRSGAGHATENISAGRASPAPRPGPTGSATGWCSAALGRLGPSVLKKRISQGQRVVWSACRPCSPWRGRRAIAAGPGRLFS
jgi:hypothetical protein